MEILDLPKSEGPWMGFTPAHTFKDIQTDLICLLYLSTRLTQSLYFANWGHKCSLVKTFCWLQCSHISRCHLLTSNPPSSCEMSASSLLRTKVLSWFFHRERLIPPQWSSSFLLSSVLRHGAKSRLSHKPPSWGDGSGKCHLSWQGLQVRCNRAGAALSGPESGISY